MPELGTRVIEARIDVMEEYYRFSTRILRR
jgi:hypothetical protein